MCPVLLISINLAQYSVSIRYEQKVLETNLGNFIALEKENGQFARLYIAYAACVEGNLTGCRPLIFFRRYLS